MNGRSLHVAYGLVGFLFFLLSLPSSVLPLGGLGDKIAGALLLIGTVFTFLLRGKKRGGYRLCFFIGLLLPLLPWCGSSLFLSLVTIACFFLIVRERVSCSILLFPLSLLVLGWGALTLFYQMVVLGTEHHELLSVPLNLSFQQTSLAALFFSGGVLLELFSTDDNSRRACEDGILFGGIFALLISLLQALSLLLSFPMYVPFPAQNAVWSELSRPVGTFSDPNAFGLFSVLFCCLLAVRVVEESRLRKQLLYGLLFGFSLLVGTLSGSRTAVLFFLLSLSLYLFFLFVRRGNVKRWWILGGVLFVVGGVAIAATFSCLPCIPIESVRSLDRVSETVESLLHGDFGLVSNRLHFSVLSFFVFLDNPITGVGPLHFPQVMTSYAALFNVPLGLWTDNPNNTYLGFLAEFGLIGAVVFCISFLRFRNQLVKKGNLSLDPLLKGVMISFFIVLILGPHYLYPEVLFPFLLIVTRLYRFESRTGFDWVLCSCLLLAVPLIGLKTSGLEYGLYSWEKGERGTPFRWTQGEFQTFSPCREGETSLLMRNGQLRDVEVTLPELSAPVSFASGEEKRIPLPCPNVTAYQGIQVRGRVRPVWVPSRGGDTRTLGIQLYTPQPEEVARALQAVPDELSKD